VLVRPVRTIAVTGKYARSFRKLSRHLQDELVKRERIFRANALDPRLATHRLHGKLRSLWSYRVTLACRVLFEFTGSDAVLYHDVGSHDVYR
jgi:mRNA-degrading endonuclease YafQ of YafQ-DinJ toxin-antitoxin module